MKRGAAGGLGGPAIAAILATLVVGCGGSSGLSASSSCTDFAGASSEDQTEAISKLATEIGTPELTTPAGEPQVGYRCAKDPEGSLEAVFKQAKRSEEARAAERKAQQEEAATGLEGLTEVESLLGDQSQQGLVLGDPKAPVELVEYADLQCPICREVAEEDLPAVIEGPVAEGKAKLAFRNFIIIGTQSIDAGAAALAAGEQGRGWQFVELFLRNQGEENSGYVSDAYLTEIAAGAGVEDIGRWQRERQGGALEEAVEASTEEAQKLELVGTPSFAIEGPGTQGLELLASPESSGALIKAIDVAGGR